MTASLSLPLVLAIRAIKITFILMISDMPLPDKFFVKALFAPWPLAKPFGDFRFLPTSVDLFNVAVQVRLKARHESAELAFESARLP